MLSNLLGSWKMLPFEALEQWAMAFDVAYEEILAMLPKFAIMQMLKNFTVFLTVWCFCAAFAIRASETNLGKKMAKPFMAIITIMLLVAWIVPPMLYPELYGLEYFR